mgnify:CR=1 FL=1
MEQPTTETTTGYRDHADPFKPLNDEIRELREALARKDAANNDLRASLRRDRVNAVQATFGIGSLVAIVCGAGWLCFRGMSFGEPARRNAEREATSYFRRTLTTPPTGIYCGTGVGYCGGNWMLCNGLMPDGRRVRACCDDDGAAANDGCRPTGKDEP